MALDPDLPLEELAVALAPHIALSAVFDGWTMTAVDAAAGAMGINPAVARLAYRNGATDMIGAWVAHIDAAMVEALPAPALAALPIRERIARLIRFRLDQLVGREEALRRAMAIMAMPQNLAAALRLGWASADAMWRQAGDTATDYNHYTKRVTVATIYAATLTVFANDSGAEHRETNAFLDRRIDDVMRFERAKARMTKPRDDRFSLVRLAGRLRYPAR